MKITRIFLDLDDVLNEFTMSTLNSLGCGLEKYDPSWGWDIIKAANASHPLRNYTPQTFWDSLSRKHWATRPKSKLCDWLINRCRILVGRKGVFILTSPTIDPDSIAGKLEWIQGSLPSWIHRQYMIGPPKYVCSNPNSLLIDDRNENVDKFRSEGGHAILVPRPWNRGHALQGMGTSEAMVIDLELNRLFGERNR